MSVRERYDAKEETEKPRKLEDETATFLLEIENEFDALTASNDWESRKVLVENVLNEIENRSASAACDRRTNVILEKLCAEAPIKLLISLTKNWTPYAAFLARNRFASHVLQVCFCISSLCLIIFLFALDNRHKYFQTL